MVKVSIEVRNGAARFDVAVQAENIQRALSFVGKRYPDGNVRVKFPIDAERFFVKGTAAQTQMVGYKQAGGVAA
jgi:hypothetical protein